jgi:hypothetical protein
MREKIYVVGLLFMFLVATVLALRAERNAKDELSAKNCTQVHNRCSQTHSTYLKQNGSCGCSSKLTTTEKLRGHDMGFARGVYIFDMVLDKIINEKPLDKKAVIEALIDALEDADWDNQFDSDHWENPLVREVFRERNPDWFDDDDWHEDERD